MDKTSSTELSEAIHSMYRWYQEADVCYVYLSDVPSGEDPCSAESAFSKSRWFTRGWTLQELIAPSSVIFVAQDWKDIGTKSSLQEVIRHVTGIQIEAFLGNDDDLRKFSVAQKMSWAAKRETTRIEDLAYCLLGLFGINMPMMYGEGEQAFIRLQEEIIKGSDDPTIFAWRSDIIWDFRCGLLATAPSRFLRAGNIIRSRDQTSVKFTLSNQGIHIQLPVICVDEKAGGYLGVLSCHDADDSAHLLGIFLQLEETREHGYRCYGDQMGVVTSLEASTLEEKAIYIKQFPPSNFEKLARRYRHYRIRAAEVQGDYPVGFVHPNGEIEPKAGLGKDRMGAIGVSVNDNSVVVVLKIVNDFIYANIVTPSPGESLEEIVQSFHAETSTRKRIWRDESDRIVRHMSQGGSLVVAIRRQIVSNQRTVIVDITT